MSLQKSSDKIEYLVDSNVLIQAKNMYYRMDFCPGFWEWFSNSVDEGKVKSISFVKEELEKGNDELKSWIKTLSNCFLHVDDKQTQKFYEDIINYVMKSNYKDSAKNDFIQIADPWIIAKAKAIEATVVTHEKHLDPNIKKKVKIPNICKEFHVPYIDTFDMLQNVSARFILG